MWLEGIDALRAIHLFKTNVIYILIVALSVVVVVVVVVLVAVSAVVGGIVVKIPCL